jgi:hypothetical protein
VSGAGADITTRQSGELPVASGALRSANRREARARRRGARSGREVRARGPGARSGREARARGQGARIFAHPCSGPCPFVRFAAGRAANRTRARVHPCRSCILPLHGRQTARTSGSGAALVQFSALRAGARGPRPCSVSAVSYPSRATRPGSARADGFERGLFTFRPEFAEGDVEAADIAPGQLRGASRHIGGEAACGVTRCDPARHSSSFRRGLPTSGHHVAAVVSQWRGAKRYRITAG